ncbi:MAG: MFS transporter [Rhodocyclaceae bacterium]
MHPPSSRPLWAMVNGFAALGAVGSVLVARQPEFELRWALHAGTWGWVLFAAGLGGVMAYPVNRWVLTHWGSRTMLRRLGTLGALVTALIPWLPGLPGLLAGMFVQAVLYNGVGVAVNHQAAQWELHRGVRMMGRLHATFYIGSMASAFASGVIATTGMSLEAHMALVALLVGVLHRHAAGALPRAPLEDAATTVRPPVDPAWVSLGIVTACHAVVESGIMGWSVIYLHQSLQADAGVAGLGLALFAGAMALGRFATDALVSWLGPARVVVSGALACALALLGAAAIGSLAVALGALIVSGLGLAAIAPVLFSAAGRIGGEALARVFALGAVGGLFGPLLLAQVATRLSLAAVIAALAVVAVLMAWQARVLRKTPGSTPATVESSRAGAA